MIHAQTVTYRACVAQASILEGLWTGQKSKK